MIVLTASLCGRARSGPCGPRLGAARSKHRCALLRARHVALAARSSSTDCCLVIAPTAARGQDRRGHELGRDVCAARVVGRGEGADHQHHAGAPEGLLHPPRGTQRLVDASAPPTPNKNDRGFRKMLCRPAPRWLSSASCVHVPSRRRRKRSRRGSPPMHSCSPCSRPTRQRWRDSG